jgi:LacI family transcriptional regulator
MHQEENYKPQSLEDIARLSGVSRSTVSRVINQHPNVSSRTRERVMAVIDQYDFQPHPAARALASLQSKLIGILIPHAVSDIFIDPFFSILLQGITTAANHMDYTAVLWLTSAEADEKTFYNRVFNNRLVDGIVVASAMVDEAFLDRMEQTGKPFILVGRPFAGQDWVNYVDVENRQGAQMIVEYLLGRGYQRIAMIPGRPDLTSTQDRQQGYVDALQGAGITIDMSLITPGRDYTEKSGYESTKSLIKHNAIDAIFAANDVMALGAIRAIHEAGLRIPEDIAVAGFDDVPSASVANPALTTVRQPIAKLGDIVTSGLINLLDDKITPPIREILPVELVIRQST